MNNKCQFRYDSGNRCRLNAAFMINDLRVVCFKHLASTIVSESGPENLTVRVRQFQQNRNLRIKEDYKEIDARSAYPKLEANTQYGKPKP
jgi:hypothetical protein